MYSFDAELNAARCIEVPRNADFSLDLASIRRAVETYRPKMFFIASPNNPDGSVLTLDMIDELLSLPTLIVLDEAYIEFADEPSRRRLEPYREVPSRENLVVLRTLVNGLGWQACRIGYGAFPHWLMPTLWKSKQPYNVNVAASVAAQVSLEHVDELAKVVGLLIHEQGRLFAALQKTSTLRPYPTRSNFIFVPSSWMRGCRTQNRIGAETRSLHPLLQQTRPARSCPNQRRQTRRYRCLVEGGGVGAERKRNEHANSGNITSNQRTQIEIKLDLDGSGKHEVSTGIGFLDHMLTHLAVHGLFDLSVQAKGDLHIDPHHTVEDVALALGQAFDQALGDRKGIVRMADCFAPMDETLAHVAIDLSGRPYSVIQAEWHAPYVGNIPTTLFPHFFESFAVTARCNLHARILYGRDDHHQAEALFKAWARALDMASQIDPRRAGVIPSTKGKL